jgi:hypothetical protein
MTERPRRLPGELVSRALAPVAEKVDRSVGWDRLTPRLAIATLLGIRHRLRARNLYDTRRAPPAPAGRRTLPQARSGARSIDGAGTDVDDPRMGAAHTPFGRNAPLLDDSRGPDALEVSEALLTRREFFPAETLNLLAAVWVQFEVHDWFVHATRDYGDKYVKRMQGRDAIAKPKPLHPREPPFVSDQTHWWDASQLYGAEPEFAKAIRVPGDCRVLEDLDLIEAMEPFTAAGDHMAAGAPNLWVGTALLHILFAREHNAICAMLADRHPAWDPDRLFDTARLINAAVMAKIHTVEWTPAVVAHPATAHGARRTWSGLAPPGWRLLLRWLGDEVLTGIPGSRLSHDGAPYALTEEFVAVYRMHQLIPDEVTFRRLGDGAEIETCGIGELTVEHEDSGRAREKLGEFDDLADAFYSLATELPGEITLHNHPEFLQAYRPTDGHGLALNLGMVDILRTRQTGVPRYNDFRRLFRLEPATSFHEIANGNPKWAKEIREVYGGELEDVDLLVGMYAERKPKGFAFSDTAFRVFLLMAARRLRSDRFFTTDYTPEVYTREGLEWIADATMTGLLLRHFPALAPALSRVDGNVFAPWPKR